MERILVLDNGAGDIKAAIVESPSTETPNIRELQIPNALSRPGKTALAYPTSKIGSTRRPNGMLVGAEMWDAPDFGGMMIRRAHERGIITSFDTERDVWASLMSKERGFGLTSNNRKHTSLLLTEPIGIPLHCRIATDELVFEEFGFGECSVLSSARCMGMGNTALIIDSGFSSTTVTPVVNGWELINATKRLNLGGKALTNQLKTTVSYRSWNMMDEPVVMNAIKERTCFVSLNFLNDLSKCKQEKKFRLNYILPDASAIGTDPLGHIREFNKEIDENDQVLIMNNERISVPELLFNPSDTGLLQAGIPEIVTQVLADCPEQIRPLLCENIVLIGGNCRFPNFRQRLVDELRPLINEFFDLNVSLPDDPVKAPMRCAVQMVVDESLPKPYRFVTKAEYEEEGSRRIAAKYFCRDLVNNESPMEEETSEDTDSE